MAADPLARYKAKRDFTRTAEPAGEVAKTATQRFVVQKHDATRLHWDFRLEIDGVLKSWAVTRGPSANPNDKRLAVRTEDHPLSYIDFEGTIPKGEYGGGTVMLWDEGTWAPIAGKSAKDLDEGHLHFVLDGQRMKGEWLLVRLKPRGKEKAENWLLRKVDDAAAGGSDDLVARGLTSIATGRTMDEIAAGAKPARPARARAKGKPPAFRAPQLATLVDAVPAGNRWLHEVKYDGYRALLSVGGGRCTAYTRTGLDWTEKFASVAAAAAKLDVTSALIDGEVCVLDAAGRPSFGALQAALKDGTAALTFFAFDLLELDGRDLAGEPNVARKEALRGVIPAGVPELQFAEHIVGAGEALYAAMCAQGYEGIVSKRADARYVGRRTQAWVKVKCLARQEFVIVGWTPSSARARAFASLLLGQREEGGLRYAGKVGTGFDAALIDELRAKLDRLAVEKPTVEAPRAAVRGAHWVRPELVAEVAFAERTTDGVLRHPSFIGLRGDKPTAEVVPEVARPVPKPASAVKISNPDRVIFPGDGITKGQLADYYSEVGAVMLPWIAGRPVSLVRCPQGRAKQCFFQKHDAGSFGELVHKVPIRESNGDIEDYLWLDSIDGVLACVQMGTIEFHGWGAKADDVERPDRMVFDLDPDEGLGFADTKKAAAFLRDRLSDLGLVSFAMLSGGKGVHVVVPLRPDADWPRVKDFASRFAQALGTAEPERFVATMSKAKRKGRIFIDWLRNQRGATAVLPYVVRARPGAPVAAPVTWTELVDIESAARFTLADAALLVERAGGAGLAGWGAADQALPDL